ncbi:MAG: YihY/virulence factor BrkB family protein, partial [Chloroflexi bacterium]|nr:YihY/virulence factor BrkB family protein [Chloroflexota bacterium]
MPIKIRVENAGNNARSRLFQNCLVRNRLNAFIWRVCLGMIRDDATHLAAGVAYYAVFSFIPLMIGFLALLGLLLNSAELQQQFLNFVTANTPGASAFATNNVQQIVKFRGILGIGGLLGLVGMGLAVFVAVSRTINRAWGIRKDRPFYINIPRQLLMTIVPAILLLLP